MNGLHGCDNLLLRQTTKIIWVQHLDMFNTVAESRQLMGLLVFSNQLQAIDGFVVSAVTYGVNS